MLRSLTARLISEISDITQFGFFPTQNYTHALIYIGLVSSFNGISNNVGYLLLKPLYNMAIMDTSSGVMVNRLYIYI